MKLFSFLALLSLSYNSFGQIDNAETKALSKFEEVFSLISSRYVDDVEHEELTDAAIIALLEKLDPHSTYISKEDVNDANRAINGSFVGIGIRFQILKDTLMVVATIPGGPSEKLGLLPGDKIITIEDENVAGTGLKNGDVRDKLMGDKGTQVKIEVKRKRVSKPIDFVIKRDVIPVNSVETAYMVTETTGYIKLNSFSRSSLNEVREGIKKLTQMGMQNLIFDLQGNGGGLLYSAKYLADEFLSGTKLVVYSEGRAQPRQNLETEYKGLWEDGRLIVLTNEYSASASEILSGAVQDWDRGLVVGRRTFGKGLVQRPIDLSDGAQIRLTIARYYTPSGRFIQKPYDDREAYSSDLTDRYENGEFMHQDSIKMVDSLMFETLIKKRSVYGGGGIMPDIFVPLDTSEITDFYSSLIRTGHLNNFALDYVNKNREALKTAHPTFEGFKTDFEVDRKFVDIFFDYIKKEEKDLSEDEQLEFNKSEYAKSEDLLALRMKAVLARNLWGYSEFYQIYNATNEILKKAIEVIESDQYIIE
ncbi:S41 family peptidase [Crocinitomicaceae bacterium]|nr:S41 family peptidase [Crocinitomicaceae bacterium]